MTDPQHQQQINQLLKRLNALSDQQQLFQQEITQLRSEIQVLRTSSSTEASSPALLASSVVQPEKAHAWTSKKEEEEQVEQEEEIFSVLEASQPKASPVFELSPAFKADLEKFIGENLINKIGIAITVLGVGIGAKYSIDNQLISPLTRIILGYLMGMGLMGFAIRLKPNYENLSAVLLSGAMAIMYFITYAAYSFYALIPQLPAFGLMLLFTAFTVLAALRYNRQVIAHIGLVGAYAVPFLLSRGDGQVAVLFSYMTVINAGILVIAYRRYWKALYYVSFGLSWLIYLSWYVSAYQVEEHFGMALAFLAVFFILFYLTFLSYKLIRREQFEMQDVLLLLGNSFIFYAGGYAILDGHETGEQLLGLFTLLNAAIHFGVSVLIYQKKLAEKNLFYLLAGLVLVFIAIAIPVQLDGNWVTLLWSGQALLLFWIGRKRQVPVYEVLSYPLMLLAFFSLLHDWSESYDLHSAGDAAGRLIPLLNIHFLSSLLFIAAFAGMLYIHRQYAYTSAMRFREGLLPFIGYLLPFVLLLVSYYALYLEINHYWDQRYLDSALKLVSDGDYGYEYHRHDYDLRSFQTIWLINYSLLFLTLLSFVNILKIRSRPLGIISLCLNILGIVSFLGLALYSLSELRESYLGDSLSAYYHRGSFHLLIRYISLAFFAGLIYACYRLIQKPFMGLNLRESFDYLFHFCLLWILSSELINWLDIAGYHQTYKLGLSILWGLYALLMISLGIWKQKKHLRLGAIGLFALTLLKLFFYDIAALDTIAKTVVFVSLGILLLIISFLYNKFKHLIADEA